MKNSRRDWFKKTGLAVIGLSLASLEGFAFNEEESFNVIADPVIRLRSNENPYGPSAVSRAAMAATVNSSNRYGWTLASELIAAIAKKNGLSEGNVLLAPGSIEILDISGRLASGVKGNFVIADTTFGYWTMPMEHRGLKKIEVPLTKDKKNDLGAMLKAIGPDTRLVYICNPNNPTGTVCKTEELIDFAKAASRKAIVVIDEAYIEFTDETSMSSLVREHKNIIVSRTFSKAYGLAGARVGYALAHADTISEMDKLQSYVLGGVGAVSSAGAIAEIKDGSFVKKTRLLNDAAKKYTVQQLEKLGIPCIPSATNFIYLSLAAYKKDYFQQLENNNIEGTQIFEENGKWTRITIGTIDEMQQFIKAIS